MNSFFVFVVSERRGGFFRGDVYLCARLCLCGSKSKDGGGKGLCYRVCR